MKKYIQKLSKKIRFLPTRFFHFLTSIPYKSPIMSEEDCSNYTKLCNNHQEMKKKNTILKTISIPTQDNNNSIESLFKTRKTIRSFSNQATDFKILKNIISLSMGKSRQENNFVIHLLEDYFHLSFLL